MTSRTIRTLLAAGFALATALPALAEEPAVHTLPSPAWAVEFGLANATLTSFEGATFSLRHQRDEHAAWRYSLSLSGSTSDSRNDRSSVNSPATSNDDYDSGSFSANVGITRLSFPAPEAVVRPWYGFGMEAGWASSGNERTTRYRDNGAVIGTQGYSSRTRGPSVAVLGLFGLEWSASERFAIHAQYGQGVRYRRAWEEYEEYQSGPGYDSRSTREGPLNEWSTYPASARAGVSVFY